MTIPMDVIYNAARDIIRTVQRRRIQKMLLGNFIKILEKRCGVELSRESKEEILNALEEEGRIKIVKSKYGKRYVIIGDLI